MKVITGDRQSGKTTEAIKLANKHDGYLVVHSKNRASQVYHSDDYPDLDQFPITYHELEKMRGSHPNCIVIDDLDMFLHSQIGLPIEAVTMTSSETTVLGGGVDQ